MKAHIPFLVGLNMPCIIKGPEVNREEAINTLKEAVNKAKTGDTDVIIIDSIPSGQNG